MIRRGVRPCGYENKSGISTNYTRYRHMKREAGGGGTKNYPLIHPRVLSF
ncbi:MAG: hypothetical protein AVDCRST_MAG56-5662 [uncultured Cytophagales bacterium]|uniref:Uncharacterized protein n=1 Tax=uncultured Cytophagales bacterium TaxID=158755 RepID=A0A6J4KER4_9SPHI|nr:MAG: hypothetical protein AVDCRST_MAG56-5662 [uncultured Cytophagales bacterium]